MPAESKAIQSAAGIAYEAKKTGKKLKPDTPSAGMAKSMDLSELKKFASTPRTGLPEHKGAQPPRPATHRPKPRQRKVAVKQVGTPVQKFVPGR